MVAPQLIAQGGVSYSREITNATSWFKLTPAFDNVMGPIYVFNQASTVGHDLYVIQTETDPTIDPTSTFGTWVYLPSNYIATTIGPGFPLPFFGTAPIWVARVSASTQYVTAKVLPFGESIDTATQTDTSAW